MGEGRESDRGMLNQHRRQQLGELARMDAEESALKKQKHAEHEAKQKELSAPKGTTGTMTLVRVIGLPLAAAIVFFSMSSGSQVAERALPIFVGLLAVTYFLPTIEAVLRKHSSLTSIVLVNIFLGWTLVGWVAAIAWACAGSNKPSGGATETPASPHPTPPPTTRQEPVVADNPIPTPQNVSVADELQKLATLRDQGILTDEEFGQQKAKVLAR